MTEALYFIVYIVWAWSQRKHWACEPNHNSQTAQAQTCNGTL